MYYSDSHISLDPRVAARLTTALFVAPLVVPILFWAGTSALARLHNSKGPAIEIVTPVDAKPLQNRVPARSASAALFLATRIDASLATFRSSFLPRTPVMQANLWAPADRGTSSDPEPASAAHHFVFAHATYAEGMVVSDRGVSIKLNGFTPLPADAQCKRLDGVIEPCAERASARFAVLTMGQRIICSATGDAATRALSGECTAGKADVADDLIRNGLGKRATSISR